MSYNFDIIGVTSVLQFFNHQQRSGANPNRSKAYVGSYICTLDSFIKAADVVPAKPDWNWNEVVTAMVSFWMHQEEQIRHWKLELESFDKNHIVVGRVTNFDSMRGELERLFEE